MQYINCVEKDTADCKELRYSLESFIENKLNPILPKVSEFICNDRDRELISCYFSMMNVTKNASNEQQYNVIGEIFICQPDLIIEYIEREQNKEFWVKSLEFGFYNVTSCKEDQIKQYKDLRNKIMKLKEKY